MASPFSFGCNNNSFISNPAPSKLSQQSSSSKITVRGSFPSIATGIVTTFLSALTTYTLALLLGMKILQALSHSIHTLCAILCLTGTVGRDTD